MATQLMDSKQSIGERALRATTGVQKVEIDQRRRLSTLKKRVMEEMQNINEVRDFTRPYIPKETQAKMNPRTLTEFQSLSEQLKQLNKQLKAMSDKTQSK
jgi:Mg2+ and Co2+ transporter CorA